MLLTSDPMSCLTGRIAVTIYRCHDVLGHGIGWVDTEELRQEDPSLTYATQKAVWRVRSDSALPIRLGDEIASAGHPRWRIAAFRSVATECHHWVHAEVVRFELLNQREVQLKELLKQPSPTGRDIPTMRFNEVQAGFAEARGGPVIIDDLFVPGGSTFWAIDPAWLYDLIPGRWVVTSGGSDYLVSDVRQFGRFDRLPVLIAAHTKQWR